MNKPLICHFLIGIPASGKSTFASQLATLDNYTIVSTDSVRSLLYGDEAIQGNWHEIETKVLAEISENISVGIPIIYDATNAKRSYRMDILQKLPQQNCYWIAWYLKTPLHICLKWNKQRTRQVPEVVIEKMYQSLKKFPPLVAEGFTALHTIDDGTVDLKTVQQKINTLTRSNINRQNRTHSQDFHPYSRLLDFDRLIHLISLLIQYPGLGNLQYTQPDVLINLFREQLQFSDSLAEIVAVMAKLKGEIYADREAIATDLRWLESNGIVGRGQTVDAVMLDEEIFLGKAEGRRQKAEGFEDGKGIMSGIVAHPYSDVAPFQRLMTAIRLILNRPFLRDGDKKSLDVLAETLSQQPGMGGDCRHQFRKDVEHILKPFQILPEFPMRHGYFAGTGILSQSELKRLQDILQAQVKSMEDPVAVSIYQQLCQRIGYSKIDTEKPYPVRAIAHQSMIDLDLLSENVLSRKLEVVEDIIIKGKLVELGRLKGKGKFTGDVEGTFAAWLLQIVFFNNAWYLGFEYKGGSFDGLLRFERLDRLYISQHLGKSRSQQQQLLHLQRLQKLLDASFGIFLGSSAAAQSQFLSKKKSDKSQVILTVELWFNEEKFKFVCEKTKRFPSGKLKMSPPPKGSGFVKDEEYQKVFCLSGTKDKYFPHRFRVELPCWCLKDVSFLSWVIGFGGHVKVVKPDELIDIVYETGLGIVEVYEGKQNKF